MREGQGSSPASPYEAENSQRPWWTDRGLVVLVTRLIRTWLFKRVLNAQVEQAKQEECIQLHQNVQRFGPVLLCFMTGVGEILESL